MRKYPSNKLHRKNVPERDVFFPCYPSPRENKLRLNRCNENELYYEDTS